MDEILQKSLGDAMVTLLTLVTTVLIPYAAVLMRSWVKAKIAKIEDQNLRDGLNFAFDRLDATAETVVREIEQVLKKRIEGKVVRPEALLSAAMNRVWQRLPPQAMDTLKKNYNPETLQKIVRGKIESKVKPKPVC
jgi:hypothetical protein